MGMLPFALSIHHFVNTVGSDAGFASIIGLAILVLLYFAQMRETSTLRDQATESAERVRQLEGRLTQVQRAQAVATQAAQRAQPLKQAGSLARVPGAVPAAAAAAARGSLPRIAPAGVGAPALSAATKLIPTGGPEGGVAVAPPPAAPARVAPIPFDDLAPAPATVAGAGNGGTPPRLGSGAGAAAPPRVQIRPGQSPPGGRRSLGSGRGSGSPGQEPRSRARTIAYGIAGLIVLIAVVVVLLAVTSGGGSSSPHAGAAKPTNSPSTTAHKKSRAGKVTVDPAKVTVSVLNGTATNLLAEDISVRLGKTGFKAGYIGNAQDQTHATTIVQYLPGTANKNDALAVQQSLGLSTSAVQPVTAATQAIACVQSNPCPPTGVIVTLGTDLSAGSSSSPTTSTGTLTGATSTTGTSTAG